MQGVSSAVDLLRQADKLLKREEQKNEDRNKRVMHLHNGSWDNPGPLCNQHGVENYTGRISASERWCYRCRNLVDGYQKAMQGNDA